MGEAIGVLAAVASSALGGLSVGVTRFVIGATEPITVGAFRFGIGALILLALAWPRRHLWPRGAALLPIAGQGLLYFALFPVLFNASVIYTTAARASLALSALPLLTMLVAALLRVEPLTRSKAAGVCLASIGVGVALLSDAASAPPGAWRGDALMLTAALCMALYSVWSRPLAIRHGTIVYTAMCMTIGAAALVALTLIRGGFAAVHTFGPGQWSAMAFLGTCGGAATFLLWSYALERTTPTRVAISVTVNPIVSGLFGACVLGEPIGHNLVFGLLIVAAGIVVATSHQAPDRRR